MIKCGCCGERLRGMTIVADDDPSNKVLFYSHGCPNCMYEIKFSPDSSILKGAKESDISTITIEFEKTP